VFGVVESAADLELAPGVVLKVFLVLGVDGVHFTVGEFFGEEGGNKKLGKAVECSIKGIVVDLEVVVGVVGGGVGVGVTAVGLEVLAIFTGFGVFFRAEEEHVLQKMGQSGAAVGITHGADIDTHGGGGDVEFGVGEEEDFEFIIQHEAAVLGFVERMFVREIEFGDEKSR